MHTEEKKDALQNAVEAMITFMEESRDVTDVAFEAEFMTSSEYNETLGYLFASHRAHGE
jgi:hypothetical protein